MTEPKIRFKRDDGSSFPDWKTGKIGDLIELYDEKVSDDCELPILTSSKKDGIVYQNDHFGREQIHDISGYNVLPRNYCTYRNRSDGTDYTFNINTLCDKGIVSKFYPVFKEKNSNLYFLMTLLNNEPTTVNKIAYTAVGGAQKVLSIKALQEIEINIPSLPEQQKIADFLSNVDEVIAASEEEVANLEQQKKAVMQKIFSQEVRFKKEDGSDFPEWKNYTLVSMCDSISDGDWIESKDQSESGVRLIQTGNVGVGTFINKAGKEKWISEETFARLRCKEVKPGTILVSRLPSPAGRACIVPDTGSKMITAVDCSIVCVNDDYCDDYIVQYLCSSNYFKDVEAFLAGGTRQRISRGNLETIIVPMPTDNDEQQLIADFLTNYDEAITAAKQELEKWKELKKSLLQQMFV